MLTNLFFAIPLLAEEQRGEDYDGAHQSLNYLQKLHTRTTLYYFIDFSFLSSPHRCHLSPAEPNVWATKFSPENKTKIFSFFWKTEKKIESPIVVTQQQQQWGREKMFVATMKIFFPKKNLWLHNARDIFPVFSARCGSFFAFSVRRTTSEKLSLLMSMRIFLIKKSKENLLLFWLSISLTLYSP